MVEQPELHDDPTLQGEGEEGGRAAGVAVKHSNLWLHNAILQWNV